MAPDRLSFPGSGDHDANAEEAAGVLDLDGDTPVLAGAAELEFGGERPGVPRASAVSMRRGQDQERPTPWGRG